MEFQPFPKIQQFHHVSASVRAFEAKLSRNGPEFAADAPYRRILRSSNEAVPVTYRAKIKLHGQNAAVVLPVESGSEDQIYYQSRKQFRTEGQPIGEDLCIHSELFLSLVSPGRLAKLGFPRARIVTIFGEHAGQKVQRGVALEHLSSRLFAVFAVQIDNHYIVDPDAILRFFDVASDSDLPDSLFVLGWDEPLGELPLDLLQGPTAHPDSASSMEKINSRVDQIDQEDPWVMEHFGIRGNGEGVVLYPYSLFDKRGAIPVAYYADFVFKAKGLSHRTVEAKPVVFNCPAAASKSAADFAQLVVTPARCEQAIREVFQGRSIDRKRTRKFLSWLHADVAKECVDELAASDLTMKTAWPECAKRAMKLLDLEVRKTQTSSESGRGGADQGSLAASSTAAASAASNAPAADGDSEEGAPFVSPSKKRRLRKLRAKQAKRGAA